MWASQGPSVKAVESFPQEEVHFHQKDLSIHNKKTSRDLFEVLDIHFNQPWITNKKKIPETEIAAKKKLGTDNNQPTKKNTEKKNEISSNPPRSWFVIAVATVATVNRKTAHQVFVDSAVTCEVA